MTEQYMASLVDMLTAATRQYTKIYTTQDEPDPFEEFVRETREAAGAEVPPRKPAFRGGFYITELMNWNTGGKGGKKKA